MLQLIVVFYGPGLIATWAANTGSTNPVIMWRATWTVIERFTAVIISFVINYACYFSEIFRGGIQSIPQGQFEAAQVLGLTPRETFTHVIALQVVKRILPAMTNELSTLIKDTALARIVAVKELTMAAQEYIATNALLWPLFYSGLFYLAFGTLISVVMSALEKKLSYFKV